MGFLGRLFGRNSTPATKSLTVNRIISDGVAVNWSDPNAVPAHMNSAVMACIKWATRAFPEAPLVVERAQGDTWEQVRKHKLTELIARPNPYYGGNLLWSGTILSLMVDGNAYWLKLRGDQGSSGIQELWYLPHGSVTPKCDPGHAFLSHYEYQAKGHTYRIDPADIVHFREGIDPDCPTLGLSGLKSVAREILTDNEISQYSHSILRNMGVVGVVISPKGEGITLSDDAGQVVKESFKALVSGNNRGEPLVLDAPLDIQSPGFSPKDLDVANMSQPLEARICAVLGIHPTVVGLSVGLEHSTFANMKEAREAAWESFLLPLQSTLSSELNAQLLDDLGDEANERCRFEISNVRALAEDQNEKTARLAQALQVGGIKRSEFRSMALGLDSGPEDEIYLTDGAVSPATVDVVKSLKMRAQARREAYDALDLGP